MFCKTFHCILSILTRQSHQLMMVFRISSFSLPVRVRAKADVLGVWLLWPGVSSVHHWVLVVTPIQAPGPRPLSGREPRPMESLAWSDSDRPHLILTWRQRLGIEKSSIDTFSRLCDIRTWIALTNFSLLVLSQKVQTLKSLTFKWIPGAQLGGSPNNSQHKSHCQALV